jgi:hypothetical protein
MAHRKQGTQMINSQRCDECSELTSNLDEHQEWRHPTNTQRWDALRQLHELTRKVSQAYAHNDFVQVQFHAADLSTAALKVKAQSESLV